ncbi:hypothetical protein PoB_001231400 [Plakobranchus ocellatus]|uniref:Transformer n=1 Tax=Plakobranchus ocellatus TaxID=259542 RepID=A0AAV3YVP4_9GAST|nr:hypothetical protein PoB_001231400 [Plakobranchus ocellatus]
MQTRDRKVRGERVPPPNCERVGGGGSPPIIGHQKEDGGNAVAPQEPIPGSSVGLGAEDLAVESPNLVARLDTPVLATPADKFTFIFIYL